MTSRARQRAAAALALTVPLLVSGCTTSADTAPTGTLSASTLPGAKYVRAPERTPFYVTHGFVLCQDGGSAGARLTLERVEFHTVVAPVRIWPVLRTVPAAAQRDGDSDDWAPIGSVYGRPGAFDGTVRGTFTDDLRAVDIDTACAASPDPDAARIELDIVTEVAAAGSDVDGFTVHYELGGQARELDVPWRMVGCGSRTTMRECERG